MGVQPGYTHVFTVRFLTSLQKMLTTRLVLALLVAAVVAAQDVQDHSELNIANDVFDSDIDAEKSEGPPPGIAARAAALAAARAARRNTRQTPPPPPSPPPPSMAELKETAKELVEKTISKHRNADGHTCWTIYEGCGFERCLVPQDMPPQQVWCDALKGDTSKIDVHEATDKCAGWTKSQACDKINQIDLKKKMPADICTGSKSCGGNGCWDKKTVGTVCCPCSVPNPKEYVEEKLKELMGVAMNRKGIEDLDVGASTKMINYKLKIEAATNAMTACQKKKCAEKVAESDAGLHDLLLDEDAEDVFGGGAAC